MIEKEVRALLPVWATLALAIVASRWDVEPVKYLSVPAYLMGCAGLGSWVMGHEYSYGTLGALLASPVPRQRVWATKLAIAAVMLAALAAIGTASPELEAGYRRFGALLFALPPLTSLFVAPWLTMLGRSPMAGGVFTFSALGASLALGEWIGELRYGFTAEVDAFRLAFMWWSLCVLSAVGAVMGWRAFDRLEAVDGRGSDVQLPFAHRETTAVGVTRRAPLLRLIAKELRLQQLPIVVAALWTVAYALMAAFAPRRVTAPATFDFPFVALTVMTAFYSLVLPAVIGSLACAEERQFGTLDAQLLLPVRGSTQWIVKSATALILSATLAILLPVALARLLGVVLPNALVDANRIAPESIVVVVAMTSISLYVSTLTRNGLLALLGSLATFGAFVGVARTVLDSGFSRKVFLTIHAMRYEHAHPRFLVMRPSYLVGPFAVSAVLVLMLVMALPHYRYAARRPALVALHCVILVACLIAYDVVTNAIMAFRY